MENKNGNLLSEAEIMRELAWVRNESKRLTSFKPRHAGELAGLQEAYDEIQVHGDALEDEYKKRFIVPYLKNPTKKNINASFESAVAFRENWDDMSKNTLTDLTEEQWQERDAETRAEMERMIEMLR